MERADYLECERWREGVIERLTVEAPDVILLGNFTNAQAAFVDGDRASGWREALTRTADRFPEGTQVVVLADTPYPRNTPAICLSAHLDDAHRCALQRAAAIDPVLAAAEEGVGAGRIDLTEWLCNELSCPAIIGDVLVYRDATHITGTAASSLAGPFAGALAPYLTR